MKATLILASTALIAAKAALAAASCTADLLGEFCDYPKPPGDGLFAIATDGKAGCWEYCAKNQPCDFTVWVEANAELDRGTCWVYPGQSFDASLGSTAGCANKYLKVYGKPSCTGLPAPAPIGTATAPVLECAATASPSPIAKVCNYPTPKDGCFYSCSASSSSAACLSQCAQAASCAFAVFNPSDPTFSPHSSGSCWMYPEGESYDPSAAGTCNGVPEQYVYENKCPKPPKPSPTPSPSVGSSSPAGASGVDGAGSAPTGPAQAGAAQASPTPTEPGRAAAGSNHVSLRSLALGSAAVLLWQVLV